MYFFNRNKNKKRKKESSTEDIVAHIKRLSTGKGYVLVSTETTSTTPSFGEEVVLGGVR